MEDKFCSDGDINGVFINTDVSKEKDIKASVDLAIKKFGRLDIVFSNAGNPGGSASFDLEEVESFDRTIAIHLRAYYLYVKYATPIMKKQQSGVLLCTSSVAGFQSGMGGLAYSAAKAGLRQMVRMAAMEYGVWNIRANAIAPGGIATSIFSIGYGISREGAEKWAELFKETLKDNQVIRRAGEPIDIANTALFLASDDASFISGQTIVVDGGLLAGRIPARDPEEYTRQFYDRINAMTPKDRKIIIAAIQEGMKHNMKRINELPEPFRERALKENQRILERRKANL
jgi:NAD(P)-dependent dehydrogenase (short-subunit alcohol dehydrogenase family)